MAPWHFTTWLDLLDHWQTGIAGVLALLAGFGTVAATIIIASRQIAASREEADRVIAATREQTKVTAEQTAMTVRLERERVLSEDGAFRACSKRRWRARRGGLGQKDLSAAFDAVARRVCRGPCRSPVHHQRRVCGIARRLRQAGRPFDRRVS